MKEITKLSNGRIRVRTINNSPTKTDQQWISDCDTNTIIKRFKQTGQLTHLAKRQGSFADVSQIPDLLPSLLKVQEAKDMFYTLPSSLRRKFDNSVQKLISFLQDPNNKEEAIELGLLQNPKTAGLAQPAGSNEGASSTPKVDEKVEEVTPTPTT